MIAVTGAPTNPPTDLMARPPAENGDDEPTITIVDVDVLDDERGNPMPRARVTWWTVEGTEYLTEIDFPHDDRRADVLIGFKDTVREGPLPVQRKDEDPIDAEFLVSEGMRAYDCAVARAPYSPRRSPAQKISAKDREFAHARALGDAIAGVVVDLYDLWSAMRKKADEVEIVFGRAYRYLGARPLEPVARTLKEPIDALDTRLAPWWSLIGHSVRMRGYTGEVLYRRARAIIFHRVLGGLRWNLDDRASALRRLEYGDKKPTISHRAAKARIVEQDARAAADAQMAPTTPAPVQLAVLAGMLATGGRSAPNLFPPKQPRPAAWGESADPRTRLASTGRYPYFALSEAAITVHRELTGRSAEVRAIARGQGARATRPTALATSGTRHDATAPRSATARRSRPR